MQETLKKFVEKYPNLARVIILLLAILFFGGLFTLLFWLGGSPAI